MKRVRQVRLIGTAAPVKHVPPQTAANLTGTQRQNNVYNALGTVIVRGQHRFVTQAPVFAVNVQPIRSAAQANIAKPMAVASLAVVQRLTGTPAPKSAKPVQQQHLNGIIQQRNVNVKTGKSGKNQEKHV